MADIAKMRGISDLQSRTLGDPGITIALLDGPADLDHPCFEGADVQSVDPSGLVAHEVEHWAPEHATHIASVLFGQPGSEVPGVVPRCRGLLIVAGTNEATMLDPAVLARAVEYAVAARVDVIHCAFCVPSQTETSGGRLLEEAFEQARAAGIPVVAPVGNDSGTAWCLPASSPHTLAVGSVADDGIPAPSTNHGKAFLGHSVMANGTRILGAAPGGGTIRMRGTSCAAPIVTGVLGLLLAATRGGQGGPREGAPTAFDAARAIVASATPYEGTAADAQRCVGGVLDPMAALAMLESGQVPAPAGRNTVSILADSVSSGSAQPDPDADLPPRSPIRWRPGEPGLIEPVDEPTQSTSGQSLRLPARVFALGRIDVDFGSPARRERFADLARADGLVGPPEDPATLVRLLTSHPQEAPGLLWLLTQDGPVYALKPQGPYAAEIHQTLVEAYEAFHVAEAQPDWMSLPGVLVARTVSTLGGTPLPVLVLPVLRGVYAWRTESLAATAVAPYGRDVALRESLVELLERGYLEVANAGDTAPARALNYALTNAVAVAWSLARVRGTGRVLESISVRRSRFTRPHSDCWDLVLAFEDPDDERRARLYHRHTVDVADIVPVSVGRSHEWVEAPARAALDS